MTLHLVPLEKPQNIVLVQGDDVAVMFVPDARELTVKQRKTIAAVKGRRRFLVNACSNVPVAYGISGPVKLENYSIGSLRWAIAQATLINIGILGYRNPESMPTDLAAVLSELDAKEDTSDHRVSVTLVSDRPFDAGEFISLCRPHVPHRLAVAPSPKAHSRNRKGHLMPFTPKLSAPSVAITIALDTSSAEWSEQARVAFSASADFSQVDIFAPNNPPSDYAAQDTLAFLIRHADAIFCLQSTTTEGEVTADHWGQLSAKWPQLDQTKARRQVRILSNETDAWISFVERNRPDSKTLLHHTI
jgi:hypothetical protein